MDRNAGDGYRGVLTDRLGPLTSPQGDGRSLRRRATLTLVYAACDTEHNDAVVLAEVLRRGLPTTRR